MLTVKEKNFIWKNARTTVPEDSTNQIICIKEDGLAVSTVGKIVNGTIKWAYLDDLLNTNSFNVEVKEMEEYKQPEYSCSETIYKCGKKPHWNIGDILAYYEFYSDREGECVLGKVINVELNEEQGDWFYTFEDGDQYYEASLLENETYKK